MIDIGLNSPEDEAFLDRQMATIELLHTYRDQMRGKLPADSELLRLERSTLGGAVNLIDTVSAAMETSQDSVTMLKEILQESHPTKPIVLQSLLRSALMGAGRVVFALGPEDPLERLANCRAIVHQDGHSYVSALKDFATFQAIEVLRPTDDEVEATTQRHRSTYGGNRPRGEFNTIQAMAETIGKLVEQQADDSQPVAALSDSIKWCWHVYSGAAHGYGWPRYVPSFSRNGTTRMPGSFLTDLGIVVPVVHTAFHFLLLRSKSAAG
ncbi:hypothetical protein [Enemella sp. A6]|uniref:hypothetical protein n=1 Tax=Enemella sp. A6 TaxID=3440152 RepID=UPI003EBA9A58